MNPPRQMPYGFEQDASTLCQLDLMKKYRCTQNQVHRWRKELGVDTMRRHRVPVVQLDRNTDEIIARYKSLVDAAKAVDGDYQNINCAARGIYKQAYGFKWRFDIAN